MKRLVTIFVILLLVSLSATAQRKMDNLGRGLVAVKLADNGNSIGTLISWRRLGTEYYDVTYNLYYNGSLLAQNLNNTNYAHGHSITGEETYQVAAVVNGIEQERCNAVTVWPGWQMYRNGDRYVGGYMDIPLGEIYSRSNQPVTDSYWANDIEVADLDGDGEMEFIIKRMNMDDANALYVDMTDPAYDVIEAYEFDGTRLWWIDVGANMVSGNSTETNVIAFDWDEDGAAEVVLRGADDMVIHYTENGIERTQIIGTYGLSTRNTVYHAANGTYTNTGNEYLIYLNGTTGKPYNIGNNNEPWMTYPLPRLENGESSVPDAWWYSAQYTGTGKDGILGHRDSKYFMGAPYLDGQHPSLFLGRGIYTRHKMIALNVDPNSHKLSELWRWNCNDRNSPWFGNGYHNFIIADVDEDGRDEIVYGSMVIDDNGKGLHTTGLGHGDAQHVSDFNPWRKGLEFFGCLEESQGSNYRDATTGEILFRHTQSGDDGRALMANFSNNYPGCYGRSAGGAEFSSVTNELISGLTETLSAGNLNFRIYWDGDLLSEWQDAAGSENGYITIEKPGRGRIFNANGTSANNSTKHNTCFQGDIIGDWREEFIARVDARTIRLYTTGVYSEFSLPSLWYDHQYRQAMGTQEMVYNLPPHLSYFLGEMEGYTQAPPPLITNGREVVGNNTNIDNTYNGKHVLHNEYANTTLIMGGGTPEVLTINVPAWVKGNDNNDYITTTTYTCSLNGGAMSGNTRLVKQGNGILTMANNTHTNTGETNIWGGTVNFDGTMQNSPVWMNRHTTLNTTEGYFNAGLTMEYGATLNIGGATSNCSSVTVSDLTLNYGARVVLDVNGLGDANHDRLNATTLKIDDTKKGVSAWENYGPQYITPVFQIRMQTTLGEGRYPIGNVTIVNGDLSAIVLESDLIGADHLSLEHEDGVLYLRVSDVATANDATIALTGMAPYEDVATPYPSASPDNYYLPVISIVANNTNGQAPTLSGTFTSLDGTETSIGSTSETVLYNENYEKASDASDWTTQYESVNFMTDHDIYGNYIEFTHGNGSGPRNAYKKLSTAITAEKYTVEFDAAMHYTNSNNNANKIILYGVGAQMPYSNTEISTTNYFFKISGGVNYSTNYTVEETSSTYTLSDANWYHYIVDVDQNNRTMTYTIKLGSSEIGTGTYTISDANINLNLQGIYVETGRAWSYIQIDNIKVAEPPTDINSFTFIEPGTLRVYSSVEGYASSVKTFEAKFPFIKTGNSGNISNDYLPVAIHDELAKALPIEVTNGNAHLYRSGLNKATSWSTMVVPFDLTADQAKELFGENVVIGNLVESSAMSARFETTSGEVHANQPFLIKNVTKDAPYLVMGITSTPYTTPIVTTTYFDFIGRYTDGGNVYFNTDDYFFNANTGKLSTVNNDGTTITMKGYRAYFHARNSQGNAKEISLVFDDEPINGIATDITGSSAANNQQVVYNLQGQRMNNNAHRRQLQRGVYIVNDKKVVVK